MKDERIYLLAWHALAEQDPTSRTATGELQQQRGQWERNIEVQLRFEVQAVYGETNLTAIDTRNTFAGAVMPL